MRSRAAATGSGRLSRHFLMEMNNRTALAGGNRDGDYGEEAHCPSGVSLYRFSLRYSVVRPMPSR